MVYNLININHQNVYHWRHNPTSTLTKGFLKYNVITLATELFDLTHEQMETLANKAGISLCFYSKNFDEKTRGEGFVIDFNKLLATYPKKLVELCHIASVSDRMLRYIKSGKHLKKESILALLIAMEQDLETIQNILRKAGYILSNSLPNDVVIMWILENEPLNYQGLNLNYRINETLDSLELPLLATREKR